MPSLHKVYEQVKGSGLKILLIDIRESPDKVRITVKKRRYSFPVLLDERGTVTQAYGVWGTPSVYLIDPSGYVIAGAIGPRNWNSPAGIRVLNSLAD